MNNSISVDEILSETEIKRAVRTGSLVLDNGTYKVFKNNFIGELQLFKNDAFYCIINSLEDVQNNNFTKYISKNINR
jgi:hypothetical protein